MGRFITGRAEVVQSEKNGKWYTSHNQLYLDDNGELFFVPKNFCTDGYTIPNWITWLGGGKMEWDIRPAIEHDFECKYHQEILVKVSFYKLTQMKLIKTKTIDNINIVICENIPPEFLELRKVKFNYVNNKFKRMMLATHNIKKWRINLMRGAVNLNAGWIATRKNSFNIDNIYEREEN